MANELNIQLDPFAQTGLTLLGRVYSRTGIEQTGSPVSMTEVDTALYSGDLSLASIVDGAYSVRFETNSPDKLYGTGALYVRNNSEVSQEDFFDGALDTVANVTLVDTTTTNTDMRGTDSANTIAPDNAGITANGNAISALNDVAATDIVSAGAITTLAGAVVNVDLVDTCTTNTDQRGTDGANTIAPDNAGITANGNAISSLNDYNPAVDQVIVATNNDKAGYSISGTKTTLDALNDVSAADVNAQCDQALTDYDAPTKAEQDASFADIKANQVTANDGVKKSSLLIPYSDDLPNT